MLRIFLLTLVLAIAVSASQMAWETLSGASLLSWTAPKLGRWKNPVKQGSRVRTSGKPDYSVIMQELWDLDSNGMTSSTMQLALQGTTTTTSKEDMAPAKLFTFVNETFLFSKPTIVAFKALTDNYNPEVGVPETETPEETTEIAAFLDAVCQTKVMEAALLYIQQSGKPYPSMDSLKMLLKEVWFSPYPRSKNWNNSIDSSGFEHVFLGESKKKQKSIGGLHNWIHAYFLEKDDKLDYTGYINSYTSLEPGRFVFGARLRAYNNYWKSPFSSFIFGSSPEFDLASYTICFLLRANKECSFKIDNKPMSIKAFRFPGANFVDTAYPDIPF